MKLDELGTQRAREMHRRGVLTLAALFDPFGVRLAHVSTIQHGRATPIRLHPNTPAVRDAEHQRKHERRKTANASRRANRRRK